MKRVKKMKVVIASKNPGKIREMKEIMEPFGIFSSIMTLNNFDPIDEPLENGQSFFENALIKAKYYYEHLQVPVICDDSGLCVDALNGAPGIYSARYGGETVTMMRDVTNRKKLLKELNDVTKRQAHFECQAIYYDGEKVIASVGELQGVITREEIGNNGFGYDSIFIPDQYNVTLAQMPEAQKNKLSHRYKALHNLMEKLSLLK